MSAVPYSALHVEHRTRRDLTSYHIVLNLYYIIVTVAAFIPFSLDQRR